MAHFLAAARAELLEALCPRLCWLCGARAEDGYGCELHALARARFAPDEARCAGCLERLPAGLGAYATDRNPRSDPGSRPGGVGTNPEYCSEYAGPVPPCQDESQDPPANPYPRRRLQARGLCAACRRAPRGYRRLIALGEYRTGTPLREWILALKHGGRRELAGPLGAALAEAWRASGAFSPGARLVPVPLHPWRRLERGHDQAHELARALALQAEVVLVPALARGRWTAPQGSPGAAAREANVAGAFRLRRGCAARVADQSVWLVDDVVTSGATVRACATVLRAAGAREVSVLALGRVPLVAEDEAVAATLRGP